MAYKKDNKGRVLKPGFTQRKDGRYCYRYREDGKTISIYDKNLKDLEAKAEKIKDDKKAKIKPGEAKKTLNYWFDESIENRRNEIRESTRMNYLYYYNKFVRDSLGKEKMEDILKTDIKNFYKMLYKSIQLGTIKIIHNCIRQAFETAIESHAIRENPTQIKWKEIGISSYTEEKIALSTEEQEAFVGWARKSPDYCVYVPLFVVLLGTGLRIGEALALTWDDIDLKNGVIHVNKTLSYRVWENGASAFKIHPAKTKAGKRDIPILTEVRKVLLDLKKERLSKGMCVNIIDGYKDFVFMNSNKRVYMASNINKVINKIIRWCNKEESEKAKEEGREPFQIRHFSVHNFRHTFATFLCMNETNLKMIQYIMGHSSIKITMDIYAKVTEEKKVESFQGLDAKFKIG